MRTRVALAALLLAAPVAAAAWGVGPSVEPDTPDDAAGAAAWLEPHADPNPAARRPYFNAVPVQHVGVSGVNAALFAGPNAAGGRLVPPSVAFVAYLGVWKDCDRDGYVGSGRTALFQYPEETLPPGSPCAPGTDHRRDGWVWEFLWIHPPLPSPGAPQRGVQDPGVVVWGDFGRPDEAPTILCPFVPTPYGATRTGGTALSWIDCHLDHAVARAVNELDEGNATGLRFDDPRQPQRQCGHALNRELLEEHPWGCDQDRTAPLERGDARPAATVWDCSEPRGTAHARDPTAPEGGGRGALNATVGQTPVTDKDGYVYAVPSVRPDASRAADGSWTDAHENLTRGLLWCGQRPAPAGPTVTTVKALESPAPAPPFDGKRWTDFPMRFSPLGTENSTGTLLNPVPPDARGLASPTANRTPAFGGAHALQSPRGSGWVSEEEYEAPGHSRWLVRSGAEPAAGEWFTFHARLGPVLADSLEMPGPGGRYGERACPFGPGPYVGPTLWDCEPARWWDGAPGGPRRPSRAAVVDDRYHLRDVDCLDGEPFPGAPAHAGLADVSRDPPCPDVPRPLPIPSGG